MRSIYANPVRLEFNWSSNSPFWLQLSLKGPVRQEDFATLSEVFQELGELVAMLNVDRPDTDETE